MIRLTALLVCLPILGAAGPWQGDWAANPEWCANADRIGSATPAPIRLTAQELLGYENSCTIEQVTDTGLNAWNLSTLCTSEGSQYQEEMLIMVDDTNLWMWTGRGQPTAFQRCPA